MEANVTNSSADAQATMLWIVSIAALAFLVAIFMPDLPVRGEPPFWVFAASAQSVATLFAFILAGYQLSEGRLNEFDDEDEEEMEIKARLKERDFTYLRLLSALSGAAILGSLGLLSLNEVTYPLRVPATLAVATYVVAAVVLSILFVLRIVDPNRRSDAAGAILGEDPRPPPGVQEVTQAFRLGPVRRDQIPRTEFLDAFIDLETDLRHALGQELERRGIAVESRGLHVPFGRIVRELSRLGVLRPEIGERLGEIGRVRNLVVHGHLKAVQPRFLDELYLLHALLSDELEGVRSPR